MSVTDYLSRVRQMVYQTDEERQQQAEREVQRASATRAEEAREREGRRQSAIAAGGIQGAQQMALSGGEGGDVIQVNHPNAPEGQTSRRGRFVPTEEFDERGDQNFFSRLMSRVSTPRAGTVGEGMVTALEGYGDTMTLGARPYMQAAISDDTVEQVREQADERMMRQPIPYTVGSLAGVAPAFLTGAGGAAAARTGTGLISRAASVGRPLVDPVGSAVGATVRGVQGARAGLAARRAQQVGQSAPTPPLAMPVTRAAPPPARPAPTSGPRPSPPAPPAPPPPPIEPIATAATVAGRAGAPAARSVSAGDEAVGGIVSQYGTTPTRVAPPSYPRGTPNNTEMIQLPNQVTRNVGAVPTRVSGPPATPPGAPLTRVSGPFGGNLPGVRQTQVQGMMQNLPTAVRRPPTPRGNTPYSASRSGPQAPTQVGPLQVGRGATVPGSVQSAATQQMVPGPRGVLPQGSRPVGSRPVLPATPGASPTVVDRGSSAFRGATSVNRVPGGPTIPSTSIPIVPTRAGGFTPPRIQAPPTRVMSADPTLVGAARVPSPLRHSLANAARTAGQSARSAVSSPGVVGTALRAAPAAAGLYGRGQAESAIQAGFDSDSPIGSDEFYDDVRRATERSSTVLAPVAALGGIGRAARQSRRMRTGNTEEAQAAAEQSTRDRRETSAFLESVGASDAQILNMTAPRAGQATSRADDVYQRLQRTDPQLVSSRQLRGRMREGIAQASAEAPAATQRILDSVPSRRRQALDTHSGRVAYVAADTVAGTEEAGRLLSRHADVGRRAVQHAQSVLGEVGGINDYASLRATINNLARRGNQFATDGKYTQAEEAAQLGNRLAANHLRDIENGILRNTVGAQVAEDLVQSRQRTTDLLTLDALARASVDSSSFLANRFLWLGMGGSLLGEYIGEQIGQATGSPGLGEASGYGVGLLAVGLIGRHFREKPQANRNFVRALNRIEAAHPGIMEGFTRGINQALRIGDPIEQAQERVRVTEEAIGRMVEEELQGRTEPALIESATILDFEDMGEIDDYDPNETEEITDFDF